MDNRRFNGRAHAATETYGCTAPLPFRNFPPLAGSVNYRNHWRPMP